MKRFSPWLLALIWTVVSFTQASGGTWTPGEFLYKPSLGARGEAEKNLFDSGLDRIDARLGKEIWVGDPKYGTTLQSAISAIGSATTTLRVPPGTWNISSNLTVPANIHLKAEKGAILSISTTKTLTINGGLEAGPYQIFSCTGTGKVILANNSTVKTAWFGEKNSASISAACAALTQSGIVELEAGIYNITSMITPPNYITFQGAGIEATTLNASGVATSIVGNTASLLRDIIFRDLTLQGDDISLSLLNCTHGLYNNQFINVRFFGAKKLLTAIADASGPVAYNMFDKCVFYNSSNADDVSIDFQEGTGWGNFNRFHQCRISNISPTQYMIGLDGTTAFFSQTEITGTLGFRLTNGSTAYVGNGCWPELTTAPYHSVDGTSCLKITDGGYLANHLSGTEYSRVPESYYGLDGVFIDYFNGVPKKPYVSRNLLRNPRFYSTAGATVDGWTVDGTPAIDADTYPNNGASDSRVLDLTALHANTYNGIESATIDLKTICPAVHNKGYFYITFKIKPPVGVSTDTARVYVTDNASENWVGLNFTDIITAGQWNTIRCEFKAHDAYKAAATWLKVQIYPTWNQAPAGNELWKITEPSLHYVTYEPFYGETIIQDYLSGPPTSGTFPLGKVFYNPVPAAGTYAGWACITAGTPGTWRGFGWIPKKDTTANRPTLGANDIGATHFDTTLDADGLPIFWNGSKWIKADGSNA